ncbi:MAG: YgfZ/GcvT domain-containing protein [Sumerlaeia bacterium]
MIKLLPVLSIKEDEPHLALVHWGWKVPALFSDKDYDNWNAGTGILDVSFLGAVFLKGKDRADYLNRRCTNNVMDLKDGEHRRAFILSAVGKIEADFDVYQDEANDRFLLITAPYKADKLAAQIDQYIFTEDCSVEQLEDHIALAIRSGSPMLKNHDFTELMADTDAFLFKSDVFGGATICLLPHGSIEQALEVIKTACFVSNPEFVGYNAFELHRIENGITLFGADLTEDTIPLEANLQRALHNNKGCYPGQETIATITNLGRPSRQYLVFESSALISVGSSIIAEGVENPVGCITSSTPHHNAPFYSIGYVKWRFRDGKFPLSVGNKKLMIHSEVEKRPE